MDAPAPQARFSAAVVLLSRICLAGIFIHEAFFKLKHFAAAGGYMRAFGIDPAFATPAIVVELGCGIAIASGVFARTGAWVLAGFCLMTAVVFHARFGDLNQFQHFQKNIAIAGGMLVLAVHGPGTWTLDRLIRKSGSSASLKW